MASARGGQRKKKQDQPLEEGGTVWSFTKSRSLLTTSLLVKEKKTFAPSDTMSFCKVEDGCGLKGPHFSVTAKASSDGDGDGGGCSSLTSP